MCLLIPLKKEHIRNGSIAEQIYKDYVAVAESDIEVYKVLLKDGNDLISPYMSYIYNLGVRYDESFTYADHITAHIGYTRVYDHLSLHEGLHSYASIESAVKDIAYKDEVVCRFTIPKGSYVFQAGEELCSNAIIFEEVLAYAIN